jgi:pimeloyl-ACP methyl ester carboxylesterase
LIQIVAVRKVFITLLLLHCARLFSQVTEPHSFDSGYANVNATKLYYEVAGSGSPIILIHGSFGDRRFWDLQFFELSGKHKVIRYDVRGFGKSLLPKPGESYKDTDDLNALMNFLHIGKAHICGLSMGSIIAIDFALAHPEKCLSLIPAGPRVAGDGDDHYKTHSADSIRAIIAKTVDILKTNGIKEATDYLWTGDHAMGKSVLSSVTKDGLLKMGYQYSWWRYLNNNIREFAFPDGIKMLHNIQIPTLIITAEYDLELCKEIADIIVKEIPNAKLISLKKAGHIMNMDQPEEFNKQVSSFIDEISQ